MRRPQAPVWGIQITVIQNEATDGAGELLGCCRCHGGLQTSDQGNVVMMKRGSVALDADLRDTADVGVNSFVSRA